MAKPSVSAAVAAAVSLGALDAPAVVPGFVTSNGPFYRGDDLFFPADAVGAKQSFKAECDVNNIVRHFQQTGEFAHLALSSPSFGDVTGLEFGEMMDFVAKAQASFDALPAELRRRFSNDPQEFVEFVQDPANSDELVRLGLAKVPEVGGGQAVVPVEVKGAPSVVAEGPPSVGTLPPAK